jgi:hypothetical protein
MSSNEYGYIPEVEQSFGNNTGVFDPADINNLVADNKWTQYGQLELIQTQTYSGSVTSINFTDIKQDIYDIHYMTFNNMKVNTDNKEAINMRVLVGGVEQTTVSYKRALQRVSSDSALFGESRSTSDSIFKTVYGTGTATGESTSGYAYFYNLGDSSKYSSVSIHITSLTSDAKFAGAYGSQTYYVANEVDGIKIRSNTSTVAYTDFDVSLYGIKSY